MQTPSNQLFMGSIYTAHIADTIYVCQTLTRLPPKHLVLAWRFSVGGSECYVRVVGYQ